MFIAAFDRVIPGKYAKNLWQVLGKPEVIYLPLGHLSSMLTFPYTRVKSLQFFQKCFGSNKTVASALVRWQGNRGTISNCDQLIKNQDDATLISTFLISSSSVVPLEIVFSQSQPSGTCLSEKVENYPKVKTVPVLRDWRYGVKSHNTRRKNG